MSFWKSSPYFLKSQSGGLFVPQTFLLAAACASMEAQFPLTRVLPAFALDTFLAPISS
jgi:hypothetical protein